MFDQFIRYAARQQPWAVAVSTGTAHQTYRQFDEAIDKVAAALVEAGVGGEGALVGVALADGYRHALVTLAAARLGLATTSLLPQLAPAMAALTGATVVIGEEAASGLVADQAWFEAAMVADPRPLPAVRVDPAALGRVQPSSGTTGMPKAAPFSWSLFTTRIANSVRMGTHLDRTLSLIGPESGAYQLLFSCWRLGGTVLFAPPQLAALAEALPVLAPTAILTAPAQLAALLAALPADATPLTGALTIVITGGRASAALCAEAAVRLGARVTTAYASTEAGMTALGIAARLPGDGAVGYTLPGYRIEIVDEADRPVAPGTTGLVRIAGPEVIAGYRDGPGDAFRDGWFYPGDLGALAADGMLTIAGRVDELLNIGGEKVAPETLEDQVRPVPGVADVAAFMVPGDDGEELWLGIVRNGEVEEAAIGRAIKLPGVAKVRIAWIDAVPRTPMGKVRRDELQAAASRL